MSEHIHLPRRERELTDKAGMVWEYLDDLPQEDIEPMLDLSDELLRYGPLEPCTVIIPVAAHQEAHNIYRAVSQYARQDTDNPFTVVTHFNSPYPRNHPSVEASIEQFERAAQDFHELDLRLTFRQYPDASIGRIRRDIWNAVAHAGVEYGTITPIHDILGVNHDIDLLHLPRHHMRSVQKRLNNPLEMITPAYTPAGHAAVPGYPNVSRAIAWDEALSSRFEVGYEAAALIPITTYAKLGGINPDDRTTEIHNLISTSAATAYQPAGRLITSGRRYAELLHDVPLDKLWGSRSFTHTEPYRDVNRRFTDLSEARLDTIVEETTDKTMPQAVHALGAKAIARIEGIVANPSIPEDAARKLVILEHLRRYQLNRDILDRVMRVCVQAPCFHDESVAEIYPDNYLRKTAVVFGASRFADAREKAQRQR